MKTRFLWLRRFGAAVFPLSALLNSVYAGPLEEALDDPVLTWQADAFWQSVASVEAHDGVDAAQAALSNGNSRLQTTVEGPGYLSFYWQVADGDDEGHAAVEVDNVEYLHKLGPFAWEPVSINLTPGTHTVSIKVRAEWHPFVVRVDQMAWHTVEPLPAVAALEPGGLWLAEGPWEYGAGQGRTGAWDAARLTIPATGADQSRFSLKRLVTGPSTIRYWIKLATVTPELYEGGWNVPVPVAWTQRTSVVPWPNTLFEIEGGTLPGAAGGTLLVDDFEITPLTLTSAVDLAGTSAAFLSPPGGWGWFVVAEESDSRGTGAVFVSPAGSGLAEMRAQFNGPGLLTWSWLNASAFSTTTTVLANGASLGAFNNTGNYAATFQHAARLLSDTGTIPVVWHIEGGNGTNGIYLDDVLFSPPAAPALGGALDLSAATPLFTTPGTPWTWQNTVTHDGTDALDLPFTGSPERAALTLPVSGPGVLTWWWSSRLPETASFRLHRQGRTTRSIEGVRDWKQEFLVLRAGEETVRWELLANGAAPGPDDHVWLDEVSVIPQTLSIAEALDFPGRPWVTQGDVLAAALPAPESHDGTDALVLTGPPDTGMPDVYVESTFNGPGTLRFWLKTERAPQSNYDSWWIDVDGEHQVFVRPPPVNGWQQAELPIDTGLHTVRWSVGDGTVMTLDGMNYNADDAYGRWAQALINAGEPAGPMDDPDGDGVPNLLEFAFDTLPLDPHSAGGPVAGTTQDGEPAMLFTTDILTGLMWQAEVSPDLITWTSADPFTQTIGGDLFRQERQTVFPPGMRFGRVRVTR
jgi:hypothetical protein